MNTDITVEGNQILLDLLNACQNTFTIKHPERVTMSNKANFIRKWLSANWPQLDGVSGVWIVGSTAYMLEQGNEPTGDLDLVCSSEEVVKHVSMLVAHEATDEYMGMRTYLGGERVFDKAWRQVDMWALKEGQTIDDVILGFSGVSHPHARVAYEIATGKLTVYPNENV